VVSDRDRSGSVQRSGHRGHDRVFPLCHIRWARGRAACQIARLPRPDAGPACLPPSGDRGGAYAFDAASADDGRRSRDQAADALLVRGPSRLHGIDPFEKALREQKWVAEVKAIIGK
jgi:hypothetical protein